MAQEVLFDFQHWRLCDGKIFAAAAKIAALFRDGSVLRGVSRDTCDDSVDGLRDFGVFEDMVCQRGGDVRLPFLADLRGVSESRRDRPQLSAQTYQLNLDSLHNGL